MQPTLTLGTFFGGHGACLVQPLSCVWFCATSWTAANQASWSFIISPSLLTLMSNELVMLSNHFILCHPLLLLPSIFPNIRIFTTGGQSNGASGSASVLPVTIQGWFPLGLTGSISLLSKGLSRVCSSTTFHLGGRWGQGNCTMEWLIQYGPYCIFIGIYT